MKSLFPSLIQSLVKPNTKKIKNGLHFTMSTSLHSEGNISQEFMGLNEKEVEFIIKVMNVLEPIILLPPEEINWVDAGYSIQKIFPKNLSTTPTFKQLFSYLNEAIDSYNTEAIKKISKEFTTTLLMMDIDDNGEYFLFPEEMTTVEVPSGIRKKHYL